MDDEIARNFIIRVPVTETKDFVDASVFHLHKAKGVRLGGAPDMGIYLMEIAGGRDARRKKQAGGK